MKKVGIVTFHRAHNYGAMLQTYALQTYISNYCDVKIVDYHADAVDKNYYPKHSFKRFIKTCVKLLLYPKVEIGRILTFNKFNSFKDKYLKLSGSYSNTNVRKCDLEFDIFISGSDQVWNPLCNGFDSNFFLNFASNCKKYSYAASFGNSEFDYKSELFIKENILAFNNLSVRENEGIKILNRIGIKKKATVDCDPVFLLDKREWINNLKLSETSKYGDYILLYYMVPPTNATNFALELSKRIGAKVLFVNHNASRIKYNGVKIINGVGPKEFLNLIRNAKYVITTSFHGLALSLIFNTPVFYELGKTINNRNSRLTNLVDRFGLQDFEILNAKPLGEIPKWNSVEDKIKKYAENSKQNLNEIIYD